MNRHGIHATHTLILAAINTRQQLQCKSVQWVVGFFASHIMRLWCVWFHLDCLSIVQCQLDGAPTCVSSDIVFSLEHKNLTHMSRDNCTSDITTRRLQRRHANTTHTQTKHNILQVCQNLQDTQHLNIGKHRTIQINSSRHIVYL